MISKRQQNIIIREVLPYNPNFIGIFGSYSRGDNKPDSDLDVLVSFGSDITLFDLIGIEQEVSDKLGLKVDLVTEKSLSPVIKPFIFNNLQYIYKV